MRKLWSLALHRLNSSRNARCIWAGDSRHLCLLKIVMLRIGAAVLYGIVHDQITARICVEYFTLGHPDIFGTDSPTLLGLGWGIVATWWVGALLGCLLRVAARYGTAPKSGTRDLVRPVFFMMLCSACVDTLAGITGYFLARSGSIGLSQRMAEAVPPQKHIAYRTDLWTHNGSYLAGFLGGGVLAMVICVK